MGNKIVKSKEEISRMFPDGKEAMSSDEQLALHIMHRFNIDRDHYFPRKKKNSVFLIYLRIFQFFYEIHIRIQQIWGLVGHD